MEAGEKQDFFEMFRPVLLNSGQSFMLAKAAQKEERKADLEK